MFCPKDGSNVIRVKGTAAKAGYGIISQYIVLGFIGSKHRQTSCFFRKLFHTARTKIHQDLISNVLRIRRRRIRCLQRVCLLFLLILLFVLLVLVCVLLSLFFVLWLLCFFRQLKAMCDLSKLLLILYRFIMLNLCIRLCAKQ